jgi:hypothetical protein
MEVRDPVRVAPEPGFRPAAVGRARSALPEQVLALVDARRHWIYAAILALYLLGFNGQWRVERDSALYLTIGRNLATGQGYTYQGKPQHLAFPGLPLLFAGAAKLLHTERQSPDLALMLLLGLASLGLTYRLFLLHAGRPTAVLITAGLAATRLFYRYNFELLSDLPFLLGVMAFFVGYEAIFFNATPATTSGERLRGANGPPRRAAWYDWVLLSAGLAVAISMRPSMWILLLAIVLATAWTVLRTARRGSFNWKHLGFGALVIAAAALFFHFDPRRSGSASMGDYEDYLFDVKFTHLRQTLWQMVTVNVPELCEAALAKSLFGCPIGPGVNTLAALLIVAMGFWLLAYRTLWGLWVLLTIGTLLVFKPLDRYLLPVLPLLVFAWWRFLVWLHARLPAKWADVVFLALLIAGACTNLARLSEIVIEQRRIPFLAHYHDGRYISMYDVASLVRQHTHKRDVILVGPKVGRILTYVGHRTALKAADQVALDPSTTAVFALIGPSWDEEPRGKGQPRLDETVEAWVLGRGYRLGPQIGAAILHKPERFPWTLHRIEATSTPGAPTTPARLQHAAPARSTPSEDD